ncbi:thiopeptide-type bacteriocin biosynthesis protein [Kitasatospora sp. NPDC057223]|uniref:thiopeptide-type bacteriocin biosynthesis protein n=1 Tax=Kitasatospora sp. NPDC057223 TaxID=3346055 RepID=UPI00363AD81A
MSLPTWCQVNVKFPDWSRSETAALAHLAPLLRAAEGQGAITAWFVVRKDPCWRVRYLPAAGGQDRIGQGLDGLAAGGHVTWTASIYEPEVHAFGGVEAMTGAHRLFHHDSRSLVDYLQGGAGEHRRELSLMLCSLLMRSAGLDWYEQGDVWARVGAHRATSFDADRNTLDRLHDAVGRLLRADPNHALRPDGPLAGAAGWADAYSDAGRELATLNATGRLHRGLRDVLAHHVIFAWNRIGLPYAAQAALTAAAKTVVFGPVPERSITARVEAP